MLRYVVRRCGNKVKTRQFSVYTSPYDDVPPPPYERLSDFVTSKWDSYGKKVAVLEAVSGESLTFEELKSQTASLAGNLHAMGIGHGDVVAMFSPNHVDFVVATLATVRLGAALSAVNPLYTEHELSKQLDGSNSKALIYHTSTSETAQKAVLMTQGNSVKHSIVMGEKEGGLTELKLRCDYPIETTVEGVRGDDLAALPYSSGTTGLPKGTMLTHDNLVVNMLQIAESESKFWKPDDVIISPLPMFHIYAYTVLMLQTAMTGNTFVTMSRFDLEQFCELVQEYKCRRAYLVPPICLGLAKHPVVDKYDMKSLEMIMSAAAPLGTDIESAVSERLGCKVKQGWGMSELSPLGTIVPDDGIKPGSGSIGPVVASTEAKIVDVETREMVKPGENGELLIRGPQVMKGYLNAPEKTKECLDSEGWLSTGDIARADEDGYIYIMDRLKELIKYKGFQVAPAELEDVLSSHDDVMDAVVIPVLDDEAGELPRAYVVPREGAEIRESDLSAWIADRVAPHKKLRGGVIFTSSVPKTASGKILRREVVKMDRENNNI